MRRLTIFLLIIMSTVSLFQLIKAQQQNTAARFREIRHWKYINFTWPDLGTYQNAINTHQYRPENILISGIKNYDNFYYITLPRMKDGVPATLARIPMEFNNNVPSPKFEPYPSWQMNQIINDNNNCDNLQNVQNIEIDKNGQLWIIDVGRIQTLEQPISRCQPKLIIHDLNENRTVTVYNFPEDVAMKNSSFLYDLVVDHTEDNGGYAYITDNSATDPGIIVYSLKENRAWKIRQHRSMFADQSHFIVNGITITSPINIAGIALSPRINTNNRQIVVSDDRQLFFSPLSSKHLYSINTTILRNENYLKTNPNLDRIIKDVGMKLSESVGMIMDNHGVLYYGLLELNGIGVWDSYKNFQTEQKLIAKDAKFIEWPNSFTFDNDGNLIVLINRLNRFIFTKFDMNAINFRLISSNLGGRSYIYEEDFNYRPIIETTIKSTNRTTPPPPPPRNQQSSGFNPLMLNHNFNILIAIIVGSSLIC